MGDDDETKDYAEEDITEAAVLSRWDKIKQWIEIVVATKKVAMLVWSLVFGVGGTAIFGEVTDTKPFKSAAESVGIIDAAPIDTTKGMLQEELTNQLATMQQEIIDLKSHQHNYPDPVVPAPLMKDHDHPVKAHEHNTDHDHGVAVMPIHEHKHEHAAGLTPAQKADMMSEIEKLIPPGHLKLH